MRWRCIIGVLIIVLLVGGAHRAVAQQDCGVSVNLVLVGRDTVRGQGLMTVRCIYDVMLINSRKDVGQVKCTPSTGSTIWLAQAAPPTLMASNFGTYCIFVANGIVYPAASAPGLLIGKIWVSGPAPQSFTITYLNPNSTEICSQTSFGQCGSGQQPPPPPVRCLTSSIPLNTGYNPVTGSVLPVSTPPSTDIKDPYWIIVSDPLPGTIEPRPASTVPLYPRAWASALPGSQWIAAYNSPENNVNGIYHFRRCFCAQLEARAVIDLKVLADDSVDKILFNGSPLTNRTATLKNLWFTNPPREYRDTVVLRPDTNCLDVYVRNAYQVAFGLNIAGSVYQLATASPMEAQALVADTCCERRCWIMGQKYHDINCNGQIDYGEPVLSGWTITATGSGGTYSATTGTDGWYSIQLPCGTYTLTEQVKPGYTQSAGGPYIVTTTLGMVQRRDFLNCTAPPPCDTVGVPRLDSACCQFTIPIFPVAGGGVPGITQITWTLVGGTMESITVPSCSATFPNPYGQTAGTITFSPACNASPLNLMMEVNPTTSSGLVTLYLSIQHGNVRTCTDTLRLLCKRAPLVKCDSLRVTPFVWVGLNLSGRTFTIFNQKQPASPIREVRIQLVPDPNPASPAFKWNGGGLLVDGGPRPWGVANSGTPYYSQIRMWCPPQGQAPQGPAANNTVQFNLGVDYTLNWTGSVLLTVIHCDGDTCRLVYPNWCAKPNPIRCLTAVPLPETGIEPVPPNAAVRSAYLLEAQIDTSLVPGTGDLHACQASIVPIARNWRVIGASVDDQLTRDERESGRYHQWSGDTRVSDGWAIVSLTPCKRPTNPIKNPWRLLATIASNEPTTDTPRVAITFYDQDGNPLVSDTARATIQLTSVSAEITQPSGDQSGILQIVPNPAADEVRVEYRLVQPSDVVVELCDVLGRCRMAAQLGWMPAGINTFGMSTAELPVGSYMLRLRTADGVLTAPLRVVR
ncbi:MAG: hypothetical protein RML15_09210 [Bacteroidota bacterium]|nr:hypothetical protein [Bacteroidota bacterium]